MQVNFVLKKLLLDGGEPERGLINRLAAATGLKRHQVATLLNNQVKHLPLESLGAICQYLMDHKGVSRTELPAILFALELEKFWDLLSKRKFVEICFGVRADEQAPDMIVAADSYLYGEVLKQLFGAKPHIQASDVSERSEDEEAGDDDVVDEHDEIEVDAETGDELPGTGAEPPDQQTDGEGYSLKQRHVPAFGEPEDNDAAIEEAKAVYHEFQTHAVTRALVCLGSIKSNPVIEIPVSKVFGCSSFEPQDDVNEPSDRHCPFFLRYRERDAKAPSCYAGEVLARSHEETVPGIYYEEPDGNWSVCEWSTTRDAALVVYVDHKTTGVAEVAMGGFSSRSTNSLGDVLPAIAAKLWPPAVSEDELDIGVFIVRFEYDEPNDPDVDGDIAARRTAPHTHVEVIPLSQTVVERHRDRLKKKSTIKKSTKKKAKKKAAKTKR